MAPSSDSSLTDSANTGSANTGSGPPRRNFLAATGSFVIGVIVSGFSFVTGLIVFADPWRRKKKTPKFYQKPQSEFGEGFIRITTLDAIPDDGIPRRFPVIDDLVDAWNFTPDAPIGSVYLRRQPGESEVSVLHTTCPHAGCSVSYRHDPDPEVRAFHCPCHNSSFAVDGAKLSAGGAENPSPRDMDDLQAEVDDKGDIWVKYQNFYTGVHDKKAKL